MADVFAFICLSISSRLRVATSSISHLAPERIEFFRYSCSQTFSQIGQFIESKVTNFGYFFGVHIVLKMFPVTFYMEIKKFPDYFMNNFFFKLLQIYVLDKLVIKMSNTKLYKLFFSCF